MKTLNFSVLFFALAFSLSSCHKSDTTPDPKPVTGDPTVVLKSSAGTTITTDTIKMEAGEDFHGLYEFKNLKPTDTCRVLVNYVVYAIGQSGAIDIFDLQENKMITCEVNKNTLKRFVFVLVHRNYPVFIMQIGNVSIPYASSTNITYTTDGVSVVYYNDKIYTLPTGQNLTWNIDTLFQTTDFVVKTTKYDTTIRNTFKVNVAPETSQQLISSDFEGEWHPDWQKIDSTGTYQNIDLNSCHFGERWIFKFSGSFQKRQSQTDPCNPGGPNLIQDGYWTIDGTKLTINGVSVYDTQLLTKTELQIHSSWTNNGKQVQIIYHFKHTIAQK